MLFNKQKIENALKAFKRGEMIIVADDNSRENEGDLVVAAQFCTTEQMAFIIRHSSGIVCTPMSQQRAVDLELPPMVENNSSAYHTAFTISVDCKEGTTTGISAYERALTARKLADKKAVAGDFIRPGHVFPLTARNFGVLTRSGHTEAAVDLCLLCDLQPVAIIGELMNDDGTVQNQNELDEFAQNHKLQLITIADLILYRQHTEKIVKCLDKKQKNICGKEVVQFQYDIGNNVYDVVDFGVNCDNTAIYISQDYICDNEFINLAKKYKRIICIIYKINEKSNLAEQHKHAINREVFWSKYGSIAQILKDFSFEKFKIVSNHSAEEQKIYEELISNNGK